MLVEVVACWGAMALPIVDDMVEVSIVLFDMGDSLSNGTRTREIPRWVLPDSFVRFSTWLCVDVVCQCGV